MSDKKWMFSGRPTGPDVKLIKAAVPVESLKPGTMIPYTTIARAIGEDRSSTRFKTVSSAWRKWLDKSNNILLDAIPNEGFVVLDPSGRIKNSTSKLTGGMRRIRKAATVASQTPEDDLSDDERRTRTFNMVTGGSIASMFATERKKLAYKVVSVSDEM